MPRAISARDRDDSGLVNALKYGSGLQREHAERVVVDLPAHPGVQQPLRHRLPAQLPVGGDAVGLAGDQHRPARLAGRVDRGGHRHDPVRVGGAEHRAEVAVADGERVRERVVEGQVRTGEVAHRQRAVRRPVRGQVRGDEIVHRAVVPARVLGHPVVRDVVGGLAVLPGRAGLQPERLQEPGRVGTVPGPEARLVIDRAARVPQHACVGEPARSRQGPEVVVEAAVFLHQHHYVLDVAQGGPRRGGRLRRRGQHFPLRRGARVRPEDPRCPERGGRSREERPAARVLVVIDSHDRHPSRRPPDG